MRKKLGVISDAQIAKEYKIHVNIVSIERKRLGARSSVTKNIIPDERLEMLGTMPDKEFAKRFGYEVTAVSSRRRLLGIPSHRQRVHHVKWTPYRLGCLGKICDTDLAKRWGFPLVAVRKKRLALGIKSAKAQVIWSDEMLSALGRETVSALVKRFDITRGDVANERKRRGWQSRTSL
jgi:hypothetical protein